MARPFSKIMLAHSPPLPLTVDHGSEGGITAEDEEGILLALEQRHRVRHLRLALPAQNMRRLVTAIDEEFPILEYLIVSSPVKDKTAFMLPETLQAPHLHHLTLSGFARPISPHSPGPCHTSSYNKPSIRVLSTKYPAPMDLFYAPARVSRDLLYNSYSQP
jgi:hypothetical protein